MKRISAKQAYKATLKKSEFKPQYFFVKLVDGKENDIVTAQKAEFWQIKQFALEFAFSNKLTYKHTTDVFGGYWRDESGENCYRISDSKVFPL